MIAIVCKLQRMKKQEHAEQDTSCKYVLDKALKFDENDFMRKTRKST